MVNPASVFPNVTAAVVSMLSAVSPALANWPESAMEKHPAWAAAISSSGLVPMPSSNRVLNEYWALESTPLSVDIVPFPSLSPPRQTAEAFRFITPSLRSFFHSNDNFLITATQSARPRIETPGAYASQPWLVRHPWPPYTHAQTRAAPLSLVFLFRQSLRLPKDPDPAAYVQTPGCSKRD